MKKALMIAGAIFVVLVVVFGTIGVFLAVKGYRLDRQSKLYADTAIRAITSNWQETELLDRASPELLKVINKQGGIQPLFTQWRRLGPMANYAGSKGQAYMSLLFGKGASVTAVYYAKATFQNGTAKIKIILVKRNGAWQIFGFWVQGNLNPAAPSLRKMEFSAAPPQMRSFAWAERFLRSAAAHADTR